MSRTESGFTLLEVLIAFSIASLSVVAILQSLSTALATESTARNYVRAVEVAESILAQTEETFITPITQTGRSQGRFTWEREVTPYRDDSSRISDVNEESLIPYQVKVSVWWQEARKKRSFTLSTLRVVPRPYDS